VPKKDLIGLDHIFVTDLPEQWRKHLAKARASYFEKQRNRPPRIKLHLQRIFNHIKRDLADAVMIRRLKDRKRNAAHAGWAVLAVVVSILMIFTTNTGHPPLIALLPLVILVWVVGHLAIWAVASLAIKGQRVSIETGGKGRSWPVGLTLAVTGTGILTLAGVIQIIVTGYLGKLYPYHYVGLWAIMLVIKLVHAACFVGLLLRQQWSRLASALLAMGWAVLMVSQITEHLPPRPSSNIAELVIAFGILVSLFILGIYLVFSREVKSFMKN
jgi:hypothetical protein